MPGCIAPRSLESRCVLSPWHGGQGAPSYRALSKPGRAQIIVHSGKMPAVLRRRPPSLGRLIADSVRPFCAECSASLEYAITLPSTGGELPSDGTHTLRAECCSSQRRSLKSDARTSSRASEGWLLIARATWLDRSTLTFCLSWVSSNALHTGFSLSSFEYWRRA